MNDISVNRYSFYDVEGQTQTLRYAEHSPPQEDHCDHEVCGCTRTTQTKPVGVEPKHVSTSVEFKRQIANTLVQASLYLTEDGNVSIRLVWDRPSECPAPKTMWESEKTRKQDHATFNFTSENSVQVIIVGGVPDTIIGNLYFGNEVDISKLVNGHSPSKIVDLEAIHHSQVWTHACNFGCEAMKILTNIEEVAKLYWIRDDVATYRHFASLVMNSEKDVDVLRSQFVAVPQLWKNFERITDFLYGLLVPSVPVLVEEEKSFPCKWLYVSKTNFVRDMIEVDRKAHHEMMERCKR